MQVDNPVRIVEAIELPQIAGHSQMHGSDGITPSRHKYRRSLVLSCALVFSVYQTGQALEGSLSFSGNLERVGEHSLSLKLSNRIVIDALLPDSDAMTAEALTAKYLMGDEVEIVCRS